VLILLALALLVFLIALVLVTHMCVVVAESAVDDLKIGRCRRLNVGFAHGVKN